MSLIDESVLHAFREGLRKEAGFDALVARAAPRLKNIGSLGGAGLTLGALGGAGLGAVHGAREAHEQGEGVGGTVLGGLGGALRGAGKGALLGGGAGALAGGLTAARPGLTSFGGPVGAGARFGQRQIHSLTGMLSPSELEGIRGGAFDARENLRGALMKGKNEQTVTRAANALSASEKATGVGHGSMNLTSIPGYVKAVREHGAGKVLATGAKEQLTNAPPALAALMVGAPALSAGRALLGSSEVDAQGRGRGERVGEEVGRAVGGVAGGVMPVVGQGIVGEAVGKAGKLVGRGVDKLRSHLSTTGMTPRTLEPSEGQHTPSERVMSPNAAGQAPEIGI